MSLLITAVSVRSEVLALASLLTDGRITEGHLLQAAGRLGVTVHAEATDTIDARLEAQMVAYREMQAAELAVAGATRMLDARRRDIRDANRCKGDRDARRRARSEAFSAFNRRRGELVRAEKRLDATRAAYAAIAS